MAVNVAGTVTKALPGTCDMRARKQAWHERSAVSTFAKHIRQDAGWEWEKPPFGKPGRTNSFVAEVTSVSFARRLPGICRVIDPPQIICLETKGKDA